MNQLHINFELLYYRVCFLFARSVTLNLLKKSNARVGFVLRFVGVEFRKLYICSNTALRYVVIKKDQCFESVGRSRAHRRADHYARQKINTCFEGSSNYRGPHIYLAVTLRLESVITMNSLIIRNDCKNHNNRTYFRLQYFFYLSHILLAAHFLPVTARFCLLRAVKKIPRTRLNITNRKKSDIHYSEHRSLVD